MSLNSEVALKCLCLPGAIKQSELWHKETQRLRTERRLWANVKMNPTAKTGVTFFCPPRRQRDINGSIHHHEERGWGPAAGDDGKSSSVKSQVLDLLFSFFFGKYTVDLLCCSTRRSPVCWFDSQPFFMDLHLPPCVGMHVLRVLRFIDHRVVSMWAWTDVCLCEGQRLQSVGDSYYLLTMCPFFPTVNLL